MGTEVLCMTENERKSLRAELNKLKVAKEKFQESADQTELKNALESIYKLLDKITSEGGWR